MTETEENELRVKKLKKRDVKFGISFFTGPLIHSDTAKPVMCEICANERAMWRHEKKDGGTCLLCFGCGDH